MRKSGDLRFAAPGSQRADILSLSEGFRVDLRVHDLQRLKCESGFWVTAPLRPDARKTDQETDNRLVATPPALATPVASPLPHRISALLPRLRPRSTCLQASLPRSTSQVSPTDANHHVRPA